MADEIPTPELNEQQEILKLSPKDRIVVMLSGFGFYRLYQQRRKNLRRALIFSVVAHVVAMIIFGGWVIMHTREEKQAIFEQPPPSRTYEPRKLEHKVKLKKQQRSSSRPSVLPKIVAMKVTDLSLPEIKVDPKLINTTFTPKFKAVSGKGLGAGLGTGYGEAGFGDGMSSYNFFGIQARGERTAILVDVSVSMVEDIRGGIAGYEAVKKRLNDVIDALKESSMFNVIVYADAASFFEKQMLVASKDNKTRAKLWIRPFNTLGNYGHTDGNVMAQEKGLKAYGGTTRLDLAIGEAIAQGADTLLVISDGLPKVGKAWSAEQLQGFMAQQQAWMQQNAGQIAAFDAGQAAAPAQRVWIPPTPAIPPKNTGLKEGQPIDRGTPAREGHWEVVRPGGRDHGRRPAPPPIPDPGSWTLADFCEHIRLLNEQYNVPKGKPQPVIHCIGYMIDNDGSAFLQGLAKHFKGEYRRVARLK